MLAHALLDRLLAAGDKLIFINFNELVSRLMATVIQSHNVKNMFVQTVG